MEPTHGKQVLVTLLMSPREKKLLAKIADPLNDGEYSGRQLSATMRRLIFEEARRLGINHEVSAN